MKILISRKVDKFLEKLGKGNPEIVRRIRTFLFKHLATAQNPALLPNCKKMQDLTDTYRWRVGDYRIIGIIKDSELVIEIIKIAHRQEAYKD